MRVVAWAVLLGLATGASRVPFRSHYLFAWDSANFALALDQYNVAFHQPQPPGYPLYVASAWAVRQALHDANLSYVALSIAASALAVFFLTLVAERLYGLRVALMSGVLLATSSVFWSQGEVAYPYAFLACFSSLVAWLCLIVRHPNSEGASRYAAGLTAATGLILGVAAGFRTELLPFLLPLWVASALFRPGTWRGKAMALAAGCALAGLAILSWYVPMVQRTGGLAAYQSATGGYYTYFIQTTSGAGKLLLGLLENTRDVFGFVYNGIGLALLPVLYFLGRYFAPPRLVSDFAARFLAIWMLPALIFYVTVHIGNPGYVLSFLPALCIYTAVATLGLVEDLRTAAVGLAERWPRLPLLGAMSQSAWTGWAVAAVVAVTAISNALLFRAGNGEGRYPEIRQIDRIFARQLASIGEQFPPQSSLLVAYDRSRQYHYYLPSYRIELLFDIAVAGAVTDTSRYWERRTTLTVPPGMTAVLFPDLGRNTSDQPGLVQRIDLGEGVDLYVARVQPGDQVRYGYQYASATRA